MTSSESGIESKTVSSSWRRIAVVLTFLCAGCLLQGSAYSHIAAFFNIYSIQEKALTSTHYGIIMGSYCLVLAFATPITAKIVTARKFKDKTLILIGWAIDGFFCLTMAAVSNLGKGIPFFTGALTVRILEAIGSGVGFFMLYVLAGLELNDINHIVIPLLETIYGVSVVIGPAVSGILYDVGGYKLPFLVFGSCLLTLLLFGIFIFPNPKPTGAEKANEKRVTLSSAWKLPVIVNVLCAMNAFCIISFNESTLALRLNLKFGMSVSESGFLFLYGGGMYAISSLIFGYLSKRVSDPRYMVLIGQVATIVSLVILAPLVPINQTKGIVILAQILLGIGTGPAFVCSYLQSLKFLSNGKETKETYAVLSAFFTSATSIGCTLGPLIAGIILDYYSYETVVLVNTIQTGLSLFLLFCTVCCGPSSLNEKSNLQDTAKEV